MKIVHVIFSFSTGGAETMLVDIVNEQIKQADIEVVIINNIYNNELVQTINKHIPVHFINRIPNSKNPLFLIRLNKLLIQLKPNIIHCHDHNIVRLLGPQLKKKSVLTVHAIGIETKYFKLYKKIFAISNSVKADIKVRADINSILVYNGINIKIMNAVKTIENGNKFKLIVVSRLRHLIKGQHLVIEALNLLVKQGVDNIYLDFIGNEVVEGESENYLKTLVQEYNLKDKVFFLGHKNRNYIYSHLCDYDLLIQPSLFEGFGLTVAEGMAAKIPVLVSNIDGPMEIIENGSYGYFFRSGDIEKLAKQIQYILHNYNTLEMKHKIDMAYNQVKNNFDITVTANNYLTNY